MVDNTANIPGPVAAYRELESITRLLLSAVEREQMDAILAEIGRREEMQHCIGQITPEMLAASRDELLPIIDRVRGIDDQIEPMLLTMLSKLSDKIRGTSNSRVLLEQYIRRPSEIDAKFLDRRG